MSVSNAVRECVQVLMPAQIDKTLSTDLRFELANILVRLKIWAGNIGVFAPDHASVDYRLRDDPDLVEVVFSMTKKLKQSLHNAVHPPLLEESDDEAGGVGQAEGEVSNCSDSSSASLDLDPSVEESDSGKDLQRLGPSAMFIKEANDVISRLYRLVTVFRKPGSSSENAKVRGFIRRLSEEGEIEELQDVKDHALSHIKAHLRQTPAFLVSRMVEATVFRRMKIRYRKHHQEKLEQNLEPVFSFLAQYDEDMKTSESGLELSGHLAAKPGGIRGKSRTQSTSRSVALSATIASSINRANMADYARSTALSGITHAAVERRGQLDVPPPPTNDRQDKIQCPYCFRIISKEETAQPRWTRHILKDIDPFICLFEDCEEGLRLFNTVEEWLGHMRWQHTIIYSCQAVGHERELFDSSLDLEGHIRGQHPDTFTESQLPGLVRQGALPAPNTLGALNISLSLGESCCVLCNEDDFHPRKVKTMRGAEPGKNTEQSLQSHIIEHLEAMALIALPDSSDTDGIKSGARQSSARPDAGEKNDTDDLPIAVFEDVPAERFVDETVPDQDGRDDWWSDVFQYINQSRPFEPHKDPVFLALQEGIKKRTAESVSIEGVIATEDERLPTNSANQYSEDLNPLMVTSDTAEELEYIALLEGMNNLAESLPQRVSPAIVPEDNSPFPSSTSSSEDYKETTMDEFICSITPDVEGFKQHVLEINPKLAERNTFLVDRIGRQQADRYSNLSLKKFRHFQRLSTRTCPSGRMCIASGGSAVPIHENPNTSREGSSSWEDARGPVSIITTESFGPNIPMPPTSSLPAQFECQLCFEVNEFSKPSEWTKHVHEDVEPFTCTWDLCDDPGMFKRKTDWVRHENENHRHLDWWTCDIENCRHTYYSRALFVQHLVQDHFFKQSESEITSKECVNQDEIKDLLAQKVEGCHAISVTVSQDEPCRFCGKTFDTWKRLIIHLSKHMEETSLPILRLVARREPISTYIRTYGITSERLQDYLQRLFPGHNIAVYTAQGDHYVVDLPQQLSQAQLADLYKALRRRRRHR